MFCLVNNFRASNKGVKTPNTPGLFGPKRSIKRAITFRSNKVKKATERQTRRDWINQVIRSILR